MPGVQQQPHTAAPAGAAQPLHQQHQQQSALLGLKEALFVAGVGSVAGMFYFYRRKQTVPFKVKSTSCPGRRLGCFSHRRTQRRGHTCVDAQFGPRLLLPLPLLLLVQTCYALSWPTLGGAIMLAVQPSPSEMEQVCV